MGWTWVSAAGWGQALSCRPNLPPEVRGGGPVTRRPCQQADSLLASPFGLVIKRSFPLKLAKKFCDPPLFFAGDELLKGSGDSGFFG